MQIKVNQVESSENGILFVAEGGGDNVKTFVNAFQMGQEAARKAWGE